MSTIDKHDSSALGDGADAKNARHSSWWQRLQDKKRGQAVSDADLQKHLGMNRDQLNEWAASKPGVGKNQLAGKLALGPAAGFGGSAAGFGYGGWGPGAEPNDANRGMKFPPTQAQPTQTIQAEKLAESSDDESIHSKEKASS